MRRTPFFLLLPFLSSCASTVISPCDAPCQQGQRRLAYIEQHPEVDTPIAQAILNGKVIIGMTKAEVVAAIGPPRDTTTQSISWVAREQWVYDSSNANARTYYFFKFGKLNAWQ